MRTTLVVIILLILWLLAADCSAQGMYSPQYVGGNYGRSWMGSFEAHNPPPAERNLQNDLWSWGGAPKGSIIVNGQIVPDPYYIWKSLNYTSGWLGKAYTDPSTGYPVYAYIDPYTGMTIYFYVDPKTGNPVYVNTYPANAFPYYSSPYYSSPYYSTPYYDSSYYSSPYYNRASPLYLSNYWPGDNSLPPVFNSNNPWS